MTIFNAGSYASTGTLRQHHAQRQRHDQLDRTDHRALRRHPDLPARDNAKALTFSGNAMQGITGTIYAPAAQLVESGNAQVGSTTNPISIVVDTLTISGNAVANA